MVVDPSIGGNVSCKWNFLSVVSIIARVSIVVRIFSLGLPAIIETPYASVETRTLDSQRYRTNGRDGIKERRNHRCVGYFTSLIFVTYDNLHRVSSVSVSSVNVKK